MNVLVLGGSRNVGYHTSRYLLATGATVTFLLRRENTFNQDETIQSYIKANQVHLCIGDALKEGDVQRAWNTATTAGKNGIVDTVLFTVGGMPSFHLLKGFVTNPPNLVAMSMLNLLATWPREMNPQPKLLAITTNGLTESSHRALPLLYRPFYSHFLHVPHVDKRGVERLIFHASGWAWTEKELPSGILPSRWQEQTQGDHWLSEVLIVRPSIFTDGESKADSKGASAYRVGTEELRGAWTISRKDTAHFLAKVALTDWSSWRGKSVFISY